MTPTCFIVLARLLDLDKDDRGDFSICAKTIARETGPGLDAVYDALIRLKDAKLIRRPLRPYKDYRGRIRPGKIKHTVFTPLFYQTINWAEQADCQSEDEFNRLALEIKNSGLLAQALEAQEEHDPDCREIPSYQDALLPDCQEIPDQYTGNSRSSNREIPDRAVGKSPSEKSIEKYKREKTRGEGSSGEKPATDSHRNSSALPTSQPQSNPTAIETWKQVLDELALQLPETAFETWVRDTQAERFENGVLVISAPHTFARNWLRNRLTDKVTELLPEGLTPLFVDRRTLEQPQSPTHDRPQTTRSRPRRQGKET